MQKRYLPFFFLVLTFSLVGTVYAPDEDINIENLPQQLADAWGTSEGVAGALISFVLLFTFLFPIMLLTKGRGSLPSMLVGFGVLTFCVMVGYLPYWIFLLISLLIATLYATRFKDML